MAGDRTPSWVELLTLMVDGPSPERTVRGLIRSYNGDDESGGYYGWSTFAGEPLPVFAGVRSVDESAATDPQPLRVWCDGARARIAEPDGTPNLIVGYHTCWPFDRGRGGILAEVAGSVA